MRGLDQIFGMGVVLLLSVPASALAQESAVVRGIVTDSTGAVIPGATVTVVHETTDAANNRLDKRKRELRVHWFATWALYANSGLARLSNGHLQQC